MSSTRLREIKKKGFVLNAYKESFLIRQRMKYFSRSIDLQSRRAELMTTILLVKNLRFNSPAYGYLVKG